MRWHIALISAACLATLAGCPAETPDVCAGVDCSGHGRCEAAAGGASCDCDQGYAAEGLSCVARAASCDPNPCQSPHRTVCQMQGTTAICQCDPGFADDGTGQCSALDPCHPNPCTASHQTVCTASSSTTAVCSCDVGYVPSGSGTGCVLADPCHPNPCTAAHKTVCTVTSGTTAECSCELGFVPDGQGGCKLDSTPDCAAQHTSGDSREPDECPALAKVTSMPAADAHTIAPAGDVDWASFTVSATRVYSATATSAGTWTPAISLTADDGTEVIAQAAPSSGRSASVKARLTAGTYLVKVRAAGALDSGPYTLTLSDEGPDDVGDTAAAATAVTLGTPLDSAIDYGGDVDFFQFTAVPGHVYAMGVTSSVSVDLDWYDNPSAAALDSDFGTAVTFTRKLATAGPWYLRVRGHSPSTTLDYQLSVTDLGTDDFGDTLLAATPVAGSTVSGRFEWQGDVDFIQFASQAGHMYRVQVSAPFTTYVALYLDGATGATVQDYAQTVTFTRKAATAGPQAVRLYPYTWGTLGSYTVTITDLGADDFGDTQLDAVQIAAGDTAGKIDFQGDVDWTRFDSIPGHIYRFTYSGSITAYLGIYLDGATAVTASDYGTAVTFTRKVATTGPQYLRVQAFSSSALGTYTLTVTDLGTDDYADGQSSAGAIALGSTDAKIDFQGDVDWFKFDSLPEHIYRISYTGSITAYLTLYLDGAASATAQDYGGTVTFTRKVTTAGPQLLRVSAFSSSAMGTYSVTVTDLGVDDFGDTRSGAGAIAAGTTAGRFDFESDADWFKFDSVGGHIYRVIYSGGPTAYLTLYLDGATTATASDYAGSVTFTRKAITAGPQFFRVSAFSSGAMGDYTVTVTDLGLDDYGDTRATAGSIAVGDTAANFDFEGDTDWFKFDSTAEHIYRIAYGAGPTAYLTVYLDGASTATAQSYGGTVSFTRKVTTAGPQLVATSAFNSGALGGYTVTVTDLGTDDFGNTRATASPLALGAAATSGSIQYAGDEDWFSFDTNGPLAYQVTLTGLATSVEVRSLTGVVTSLSGPGNRAFTVPAAGTYYLRVAPSSGSGLGTYTVAVGN